MAQDDSTFSTLAEQANAVLGHDEHNHGSKHADGSSCEIIREEEQELREAAAQTLNAVVDLTLDGTVRWASPTWQDIVGIPLAAVQDRPMADILVDNKAAFSEAIAGMKIDDTGSKIVRFSVKTTPKSSDKALETTLSIEPDTGSKDNETLEAQMLDLEAQGIMIYDRASGEPSHTMWMIRRSTQREITIDLPDILVESLGVGAEMLAQHLTALAEVGANDPKNHPPPLPVLCRICELQITPWWFPKHTELCLQEHRAEAELQLAQDTLTDHRGAIVKVLDGLESQMRLKSQRNQEGENVPPTLIEYKGLVIGSSSPTPSGISSGRASPNSSGSSSQDRSASGLSHHRARSFAVRRPLSRIVELVLDLCDTALEISTPALKTTRNADDLELRTQSPQSEGRISQVLQWQSPSVGALEHESGLSTLCDDTAKLAKAKVDAVLRFRRILEYSERIRSEFTSLVQECIDAALQKAARIAAGDSSSGSDDDSDTSGTAEDTERESTSVPTVGPELTNVSYHGRRSAMAEAVRIASSRSRSPSSSPHRHPSPAISTGSNSPRNCPTPKSHNGNWASRTTIPRASRGGDLDAEADSDSSIRSSVQSGPGRGVSPSSEFGRAILSVSRERKRKSLILPRAMPSSRQQSPARTSGPVSPLLASKPRLPSTSTDISKSPVLSPSLSSGEFHSPFMAVQQQKHHRRQSSAASSELSRAAVSPRLSMSSNPLPRAVPPSIKDFEIIKPISKGAFGSVYLAKKKSTGDYYAIKALKKADMISKNQVANVKAERAILMWQGESDFVAKLYWTFPSKDYIFLVMEYLNGGDCASLVQSLGSLPEDWAKRYLAEVVQGVEHLHNREIVHRDLKPDNLLIDQRGHLKLTDFGLSRMGLIGRQKRALSKTNGPAPDPLKQGPFQRSISMGSSRSASFDISNHSPSLTPSLTPFVSGESVQPSYFSLSRETSNVKEPSRQASSHQSDFGDGDGLTTNMRRLSIFDESWNAPRSSPKEEEESTENLNLYQSQSHPGHALSSPAPQTSAMLPPPMALFDPDDHNRRFVGTPDYLAPETINGLGQDEMSDWWSLGCILFEFLFGYPPFHAETPDKVFENILARKIGWPSEDDDYDVSDQAKDLMNRLMCLDPGRRLGSNIGDKYSSGGAEIRNHPWFADIDWEKLNETQASFVPAPENIEDTEYFDTRGAASQDFTTEFDDQAVSTSTTPSADFERPYDALSKVRTQMNIAKRGLMPLHIPPHVRDARSRRLSEPVGGDDFGQFSFKNLPVLEKANKDVIQKLRAEAMHAQSRSSHLISPTMGHHTSNSVDSGTAGPTTLQRALSTSKGNAKPSLSTHSSSSPNRASQPSSPLVQFSAGHHHERRKTSSGASSISQPISSHQSANSLDNSKPATPHKTASSSQPTPIKLGKLTEVDQTAKSSDNGNTNPSSPRTRSHTVGSNDSDSIVKERVPHHHKRRSQVIDVSPSSSDTEDPRQKAFLRVQRRRQSSRRLSQINLADGPLFRPLDVLVCEDHPVSRLVLERLLGKLRCRTIMVSDGTEALRYALSSLKFDIILMEYKLPQIDGADVARMIRETKNSNSHTPILVVTSYLKELSSTHHFDAVVEKPPTMPKLINALARLCSWKPLAAGQAPSASQPMPGSGLRNESIHSEESPISTSSGFAVLPSSGYTGSSREDSLSSVSFFNDGEARRDPGDWIDSTTNSFGGLGISDMASGDAPPAKLDKLLPALGHQDSAPAIMQLPSRPAPSNPFADSPEDKKEQATTTVTATAESTSTEYANYGDGDDEDDELGLSKLHTRSRSPKSKLEIKASSKLATEMMRTNSQGSVVSGPDVAAFRDSSPPQPVLTLAQSPILEEPGVGAGAGATVGAGVTATKPPEMFPPQPGHTVANITIPGQGLDCAKAVDGLKHDQEK